MEMTGECRLEAPPQTVWDALNDPDVLRRSIPGCDELSKLSDTEFSAVVTARVGPVKARFTGRVTLSDVDPPRGYTISGEGQGAAAGFAKGGAVVELVEDGAGTLLRYTVNATVGGKLAQIGSRLIDGVAKKMAADFFTRFAEAMLEAAVLEPAEPAAAGAEAPGVSPWVWVSALIAAAVVLVVALSQR
jgi:carbon monoxide dehydrogenase subunit G